jgi:hypothetical protein
MKVSLIRLALGLWLGLLASSLSAGPAGLSAEQAQWIAAASRHEKAGWTYLHL